AIDAGRVEAEIATLELLNQRDTMLCDDIRAACRLGTITKAAGNQSKLSCWTAVQGIGVPKEAVVPPPSEALSDGEKHDDLKDPPSLPRPASGSTVGSGSGAGDDQEDGDDHETSSSRKRVFSK
ncbi:unnamed protein product, partial [Ectocarpus fasciculatus]